MQISVAEQLAAYVAGERLASIPVDVVTKAKSCVLDFIGCLLGASATPVARIMADFASDIGGGGAGPAAADPKMDCATAAFVYATLINALDFDDIYKKGHPSATVIATALALGHKVACSGADFIEAVVAGYEVSGRVAISLLQSQPRKTVHGHGTWQTIGAAATAAKLLRLDPRQTAHAIAIAAVNAPVASVMKTVYGASPSMAKNNFGEAAQVAINAAFLARRGFEGPLDVFEGETGFWRMFGADGCDVARLTEGLGEHYEIGRSASSRIAAVASCRAASRPPLKRSVRPTSTREPANIDAFSCPGRRLSAGGRSTTGVLIPCGRRSSARRTRSRWRCGASSRAQTGFATDTFRIQRQWS